MPLAIMPGSFGRTIYQYRDTNMKINKTLKIIGLFMIVSLTWGTTWMAMKIAIQTVPPIFATGLRFLCASPVLLLIVMLTKQPILFASGSRRFQFMICMCYFTIPFTLMFYGERYTSAGLAAIIFATMPVAVLLASIILVKARISFKQTVGLLISMLSLIVILLKETNPIVGNSFKGIFALILAVIMHAIMYVLFNKRDEHVSILTYNTLPCLGAGLLLTFIGSILEKPIYANFSVSSLLSLVYLGMVSNVLGMVGYFYLQRLAIPFQASLVFLIFPVIAILLDHLFMGSSIGLKTLWLMIPLTVGILLTLKSAK
ncbi:MAG: DMT family transporter [Candidatus Dasytiphilus stammeri]